MPELSERNFCDGLERKFTSPVGGMQQAGASETSLLLVFTFFWWLQALRYKFKVYISWSL